MRPLRRALALGLAAAPLLAQAPSPAPVRPQRFSLPNGMSVLLLEDHERPLVWIRLHLALAPGDLPPEHPSLPDLTLRMMDRSQAGDLRPEDLDQALERAGIAWRRGVVSGGLAWDLVTRSRDQERALGLLAARVMRSVFEAPELEAQRLAAWRDAEGTGLPPRVRLRRALEPEGSLRPPTFTDLGSVSFDDLLAFRARAFRPDRALLVLHGDLGMELAKRLALLSFGTWTAPAAAPLPAGPALPSPAGPLLVAAPGSALRLQAVAAAPADLPPEAEALLARLLPGDPALHPGSIEVSGGCLVATLDGTPTAWVDLLDRLASLRRRGFTEADLARAKAAWSAGRALATLHPEAQLDEALREARGRAADPARLAAFSLEALHTALHRWLDPAGLRVGAAGDPAALKALAAPSRP